MVSQHVRMMISRFGFRLLLPSCLMFLFFGAVGAADNIACYYGTWTKYSLAPSSIPPDLCTSIVVAFVQVRSVHLDTIEPFDSTDPVNVYPALTQVRSQSSSGLKIIISLGGATHDNGKIVSLTNNPTLLATFAANTVSQLRAWGMDGLNVDWEFPDNKISYNTFMTALRTAIDNEVLGSGMSRLELSAALPAGKHRIDPGYDVPTVANLLDVGYIMAYDYHGPWESLTGHNSPLKPRQDDANQNLNTKWSVEYWHGLGLPKSKLYVGIPTYGRSAQLQTADNGVHAPSVLNVGTIWTYPQTCSTFLSDVNTVQFWDAESEVPYAARNNEWLSYSNVASIANKCQWVEDNQYAGAMVWSLHQDDYDGTCGEGVFPLVTAVRSCTGTGTTQTTSTMATSTTPTQTTTVSTGPDPNACASLANGLHPIPGDCTQYYQCWNGITYIMPCPPTLHFNPDGPYCDWPYNVNRPDC